MTILDPQANIVENEIAHRIGAMTIVVERRSPGCTITVGEVRTELTQIIAFGTEVVVDDIKEDRQTGGVTCVYEFLQAIGTAVGVLSGIEMHAVVAPVARAGKLCDRH